MVKESRKKFFGSSPTTKKRTPNSAGRFASRVNEQRGRTGCREKNPNDDGDPVEARRGIKKATRCREKTEEDEEKARYQRREPR